MLRPVSAAVTFAALICAAPAAAQTWCTSANLNSTERTICSDVFLGELDAELNQLYAQAVRIDLPKVKSNQNLWRVGIRDKCGTRISCIEDAYLSRIAALRSQIAKYEPPLKPRPWCKNTGLNAAERTICSSKRLSNLDAATAAVHDAAKARSGGKAHLRWLDERNACRTDENCIAAAYHKRLTVLGAMLRRR